MKIWSSQCTTVLIWHQFISTQSVLQMERSSVRNYKLRVKRIRNVLVTPACQLCSPSKSSTKCDCVDSWNNVRTSKYVPELFFWGGGRHVLMDIVSLKQLTLNYSPWSVSVNNTTLDHLQKSTIHQAKMTSNEELFPN